MRYPLSVVKNHLLVALADGLALIDTGSPQSYGAVAELDLGDHRHVLSPDGFGMLDLVREQVDSGIRYFLGYETLKEYRVLVDWPGDVLVLSTDPIVLTDAAELPMDLIMGVPLIPIGYDGTATTAILDSGASLSYAPAAAVENLRSVRTAVDFYPLVGDFETQVWEVDIDFPGRRLTLQAGLLPPMLALTLGTLGGGWIVGVDFFRDRQVVVDYHGRSVHVAL